MQRGQGAENTPPRLSLNSKFTGKTTHILPHGHPFHFN